MPADAFVIQRLDEAGVDEGDRVALRFQQRCRLPGDADHGAQGNEGHVLPRLEHFRLADGEDFRRGGKGDPGDSG